MAQPVAFITGASSGIGAALAREFATRGYRVVALARRLDALEVLANDVREITGGDEDRVLAMRCDVTAERDLDEAARARGRV